VRETPSDLQGGSQDHWRGRITAVPALLCVYECKEEEGQQCMLTGVLGPLGYVARIMYPS
jgi:hypothetical protein